MRRLKGRGGREREEELHVSCSRSWSNARLICNVKSKEKRNWMRKC